MLAYRLPVTSPAPETVRKPPPHTLLSPTQGGRNDPTDPPLVYRRPLQGWAGILETMFRWGGSWCRCNDANAISEECWVIMFPNHSVLIQPGRFDTRFWGGGIFVVCFIFFGSGSTLGQASSTRGITMAVY